MKKKLLAAATAAVTLANCLVFGVSAEGNGVNLLISYEAKALSAGDTVEVVVSMNNNTGLSGWRVGVGYSPDAFEYVDFAPGVFSDEALGNTGDMAFMFYSDTEWESTPFYMGFSNLEQQKDVAANGVLGTVTFKVKEGAPSGNYLFWLTADASDFYKVGTEVDKPEPVSIASIEGTQDWVTVGHSHDYVLDSFTPPTGGTKGTATYVCSCGDRYTKEVLFRGDVNSDGFIDLDDYSVLAKSLAKWNGIEISEAAADVNGDKTVDLDDLSVLAKYLAKWNGYEEYIVPAE